MTGDAQVLVIDDEADIRELLELSLLRMGISCDTAGCVREGLDRLASGRYRLCLTDMRLPDGDGLDIVAHIQQNHAGLPVAVISAHGSIDTAIRALKLGAFDFVTKPVEVKALRELVSHALRLVSEVAGETGPDNGVRRLIGRSAAIDHLRAQVARLARSQAPVFIHGESGTGKEVIARMIHALGPRADGAFVPVNCGAIPPELIESEFFGHVRGSFSGATSDKPGLFRAAHGGTLFLDEVAELPLAMQVKLLRAIQERAVRPVGAQSEEAVDVRILSASHRDLAALVAEGRFRHDLFYRINVIALHVPPLRERPEDIDDLAHHILARLAARDGGPAHRLADASLAALRAYPFPGNVRELENLLERACALCEADAITPDDLALDALPPIRRIATAPASDEPAGDDRERILRTLDETRWNRSEAARRLGMTLRQLRYRLQKWGME
jgi:two-component system response regulator PilR (NtrC family)